MRKSPPLQTIDPLLTAPDEGRRAPVRHERLSWLLRLVMMLVVGALVVYHRHWLVDALALLVTVDLPWVGAALATIVLSYVISSHVLAVVLGSFGHRLGAARLWATTVTAIVISQCIPAGGVGSYAFLLRSFKLRGVPTSEAALVAALEALSYVGALLLIGGFSVVVLVLQPLGVSGGTTAGAMLAGATAVVTGAVVGWAVTRPAAALQQGMRRVLRLFPLLRRPSVTARIEAIVAEGLRNRDLIVTQPRMVVLLVVIQLIALSGHSLALLLVLHSLGVAPGFGVALAAFGVALLTSTFNVLPGGGGTVETVLVTALLQLSVGEAALPAAVLFRLLNFWALLPVAAAGYSWLMRPGVNVEE
jgi:uncharacterized membrane protein YbhN (UPF0104 family)